MEDIVKWEIVWGKGSAFNLGRVKDNPFCSDYRLERYKNDKDKWKYFISNSQVYCLYDDKEEYDTLNQLDEAAIGWLRRKW
jgi:hypothetical protein